MFHATRYPWNWSPISTFCMSSFSLLPWRSCQRTVHCRIPHILGLLFFYLRYVNYLSSCPWSSQNRTDVGYSMVPVFIRNTVYSSVMCVCIGGPPSCVRVGLVSHWTEHHHICLHTSLGSWQRRWSSQVLVLGAMWLWHPYSPTRTLGGREVHPPFSLLCSCRNNSYMHLGPSPSHLSRMENLLVWAVFFSFTRCMEVSSFW